MERNSPLSTSLASSESLSTSLRSSELRNLQQLVETSVTSVATTGSTINSSAAINVLAGAGGGINIIEGQRLPPQTLDLASSANTATNVLNLLSEPRDLSSPEAGASSRNFSSATAMTHMHPHLHLQQQHSSFTKQYLQTKPSSSSVTMEQSHQNRWTHLCTLFYNHGSVFSSSFLLFSSGLTQSFHLTLTLQQQCCRTDKWTC